MTSVFLVVQYGESFEKVRMARSDLATAKRDLEKMANELFGTVTITWDPPKNMGGKETHFSNLNGKKWGYRVEEWDLVHSWSN